MKRALLLLFLTALPVQADPQPGQIVIDSAHPQWLMRHGGKHVFICGPGDPEDFLYRGKRKADGTREGDQTQLIEKLIKHGGNCIYMQIVRSHGGDGKSDHNPFIDSDPKKGIDEDILKQWEQWFSRMDENNILIYLFIYDDSANPWRKENTPRDQVSPREKEFLETIVKRFQHHKNLIWIVAEESEEAFTAARVHAIARVIREADKFGHIIGTHHQSDTTFRFWQPGCPLDHFAMQYNHVGAKAHAGAVEAFRKAKGKYQVIYSENTAAKPDAHYAWRVAMGGLMPMLLEMDIATTPVETLQQCRHLQNFFEASDVYTMAPHDELAHAGTQYVLADPGRSYIAYAEKLAGNMGIKSVPVGKYDLLWLDCEKGTTREVKNLEVRRDNLGGSSEFARPKEIGDWCAVWVQKTEPIIFPGKEWETRDPEDVGLDPKKLDQLAQTIGGDGVVIRNGYLVKTWGKANNRGDWASACKPVISFLLFFAIFEKTLKGPDDPVRPWVRKRWPMKDLIKRDRTMTFRHLANMTSGYARGEAPGTHWAYNDYAIRLYQQVMEEVLGTSLNKAALSRLSALQFQDGDIFGSRGGSGVNTSPRDFARIGWLWLNNGNWNGKQLLPREFFEKYCKPDVPRDIPRTKTAGKDYLGIGTMGGGSDQNFEGPGVYGFNWWFNAKMADRDEYLVPHLPRDAFYACGHDGKEVVLVIPSWNMVVAARGNWGSTRLLRTKVLAEAVQNGK
jgi:CubicO group peptidase (beta-lactamase class C family)